MDNRLRQLRKSKGYTQVRVQMETGIEQALLSKYENAERVPPTETLVKLADYYNVSVDYLLCRTDNPQVNKYTNGPPQIRRSFLCFGAHSRPFFPALSHHLPRKTRPYGHRTDRYFLGLSPKKRGIFRYLFRYFFRFQKFCFLSRQIVKKI